MIKQPNQYYTLFEQRSKNAENKINNIIKTNKLPDEGLNDTEIQLLLHKLASADCNVYQIAGAGEREGRILSELVSKRNFGFSHGIGRSGDLLAAQPKAAGSNVLHLLARNLALEYIHLCGFHAAKNCVITPIATGMTFNLLIQALRCKRVIWLRCDQKSVPKALNLAGCEVIIIDCKVIKWDIQKMNELQKMYGKDSGQQLQDIDLEKLLQSEEFNSPYLTSDLDALESLLENSDETFDAVISTTSCFAPREPDDLAKIDRLLQKYEKKVKFHICNNAYGLQSSRVMKQMNNCKKLDVCVSSLDKNFLVPVSGAVIYSKNTKIIQQIAESYPGRASSQCVIDVAITLLHLGKQGVNKLLSEQKRLFDISMKTLQMSRAGFNDISMFKHIHNPRIGSELFQRGVSGARFNKKGLQFSFCGQTLNNFNLHSHHNDVPTNYLVYASAIGQQEDEITTFKDLLEKLNKAYDAKSLPSKQDEPKE